MNSASHWGGFEWGKIFYHLADRFGYTPDQISEMTIDAALILLNEGKDPSKKTIVVKPGQKAADAIKRLKG